MTKIDFSKFDLLAEDGRHSALMEINGNAKIQFSLMGLSEQSLVAVSDFHIDIAIRDTLQKRTVTHFASSVELSVPTIITEGGKWAQNGNLEISTSGVGNFCPFDRPHIAAKYQNMSALLSNWVMARLVFSFFTAEHRRLKKLISEANNVTL